MSLASGTHSGSRWRVLKFGGTSVASAKRWKCIAEILNSRLAEGRHVLLVCSAVAGVTDLLAELADMRRRTDRSDALLAKLWHQHRALGNELGVDADQILAGDMKGLELLLAGPEIDAVAKAKIIGLGELMCTRLGAAWLQQQGLPCSWIDARTLLTADACRHADDTKYLSATCSPQLDEALRIRLAETSQIVITQGFIASSPEGETVLLGRGGSDTSAAYMACLLGAERLEIWTDVPGLFTANPRLIPEARLLGRIGYRAAQALGALGAKVLHPRAIEAVWEHGVPIELGWTERPEVPGSQINASRAVSGIKAITSRRNLAMFSLRRPPSWQPIGFLADVANSFSRRGLSMDLVSSSCSEIRVTLDLGAFPGAESEIPDILRELELSCEARVIKPVASVSIVGKNVSQAVLEQSSQLGLSDEALLMVVHAANEHHVSVVTDPASAQRLVNRTHQHLLEAGADRHDLGPSWQELLACEYGSQGEAA